MAPSRPVRIVRSSKRSTGELSFTANAAGQARANRLFAGYLFVLLVIYATFLGLAFNSPSPGPRNDTSAWAVLSLLALALAGGGWFITLGRTPRGAAVRGNELAVRERLGRLRRFPNGDDGHRRVVHHYPAGFLGPEPTELIELVAADRSRRTYLVGVGYFESLPGPTPDPP